MTSQYFLTVMSRYVSMSYVTVCTLALSCDCFSFGDTTSQTQAQWSFFFET